MIDIPVVFALLLFNLKFIWVIVHHALTHNSLRCLYNDWIVFNFKCNSSSAIWINGFNIFYPLVNTFNSVFYSTYNMIVHTMGSHIVCTLKALDLYKLAWRWPQCSRNMLPKPSNLWVLHCCVWCKYIYMRSIFRYMILLSFSCAWLSYLQIFYTVLIVYVICSCQDWIWMPIAYFTSNCFVFYTHTVSL